MLVAQGGRLRTLQKAGLKEERRGDIVMSHNVRVTTQLVVMEQLCE
jgi:hypothetical protein